MSAPVITRPRPRARCSPTKRMSSVSKSRGSKTVGVDVLGSCFRGRGQDDVGAI